MLYLGYKFERNKFKYYNMFFDNKRKDNIHNLNLSYIYSLRKNDVINLSTSFNRNNSNQDAYSYEEYETKLNYIKKFNW